MKHYNLYILLVLVSLIILDNQSVDATTLYADNTMNTNCTTGNYSILNRLCNGSDGKGYKSIKEALLAMNTGDTILIRGGLYQEGHIRINYLKSGSSWNAGQFNTIKSYPGEWAILDGQNGGGTGGFDGIKVGSNAQSECVLGHSIYPSAGQGHMKYWKFENLEIKNGATADGQYAAGFWGTAGPFIFRNCYIHDNLADIMANNPAGLTGHVWHDSLIEFCYFFNNGAKESTHHNSANLAIYSDYNPNGIAATGFTDVGHHTMKNEIRYNLFIGSAVAIKYKQCQLFSGRDTSKGQPDDTYKTYGDKVHHNIIRNAAAYAIDARQDFIQVYNNIIDSCASGIAVGEEDTRSIYKAVVYNNTIINSTNWGIFRVHSWWTDYNLPTQTTTYYGYDYNNLLDQIRDGWNWSDIGVDTYSTFGGYTPVYSGYVNDRNFFYRPIANLYDPNGTYLVYIGHSNNRLTKTTFEAAYPGTKLFRKDYNAASPLYQSTDGVAKYKTRADYTLEGNLTISNAGKGTSHPYLANVIIPSYIGATNPNTDSGNAWNPDTPNPDDSGWVNYVLSLTIKMAQPPKIQNATIN